MDESVGAQYAIQIAVHTLRDRCRTLQQRLQLLEEENVILRTKCVHNEDTDISLSELDKLKVHLTEVTEQKDQFHERVKMVTAENQELWNKLGKLIHVNKSLNEQFHKINETLNQHTTPPTLLRSKTFTQSTPLVKHSPQKNLEVSENLSMELENISLKLTDSFSKQKMELEKMCTEIKDMQCGDNDIITDDFCFNFEENMEEDVYDEINYVLDSLKHLKDEVLIQRNALHKSVKQMECLTAKNSRICTESSARNVIHENENPLFEVNFENPKFEFPAAEDLMNFKSAFQKPQVEYTGLELHKLNLENTYSNKKVKLEKATTSAKMSALPFPIIITPACINFFHSEQ